MLQNSSTQPFKQLITVLVALTATLSLLLASARFSLWTTIIGITLFFILYTYGHPQPASRGESFTFAAVWSLCLLLTIGWPLTGLTLVIFRSLPMFAGRMYGMYIGIDYFNIVLFICWLVAFLVVSSRERQRISRPQLAESI